MTRTLAIGALATVLNVAALPGQTPARPPEEQRVADQQLADRHLDAAVVVSALKLDNKPVKEVLGAIGTATGLATRYDNNVPEADKLCSVNLVKTPLPDAIATVLTPNGLAFKTVGPKSIFVYSDTPANRQKFAESIRTFQIATGDPGRIAQLLNREPALAATGGIRPVILTGRASRTITVRATADKMAEIAKLIAANDKL